MRHGVAGVRLGRSAAHRRALFRNLVTALLQHESVRTTDAKAKELRRWADRMITLGKQGTLHARRRAARIIMRRSVLRKLFVEKYEKLYGRGSALAGAQLEIVVCRLRARALTPRPRLVSKKSRARAIPSGAKRTPRSIYWPDLKKYRATPVFDGENLLIGNQVKGPAIVETADTTVVVHPGRTLRLDALGNFEITF